MTKTTLIVGLAAAIVSHSQRAEASAFVLISSGVSTVSCDTSLAFGPTNCSAGLGFVTVLNSDFISFTGVVGGYSIDSFQETKTINNSRSNVKSNLVVTNLSGIGPLIIDFGAPDFVSPGFGPLLFEACQTSSWTTDEPGNSHGLTTWAKADNTKGIPGVGGRGGSTKHPPVQVSPPKTPVKQCVSALDFTPLLTPFSITGEEVILLAVGGNGSFTAEGTVTAVPEPASIFLLGAGLAGLAVYRRRLRKQQ